MFGKFKKSSIVSNIVHLEIIFNLDEINNWVRSDFKGNLLDKGKLAGCLDLKEENTLKYKFDLLPHANEKGTIFYHRNKNTFSDYLGGCDYFLDASPNIKKFRELNDKISGVEWCLHNSGTICLYILESKKDGYRKNLIVVPTNDIYLLQIGDRISDYRANSNEITIEVNTSKTESIKIKKSPLGLIGKGIGYRNILCQVKAYNSDDTMIYNQQ